MVKVDTTQWPLVLMEVDGLATPADMQAYVAAMETVLPGNIFPSRNEAVNWMAAQVTLNIGENFND
jgi:hypothetical protein